MAEMKKVATRDSYGNALVELGKEHEDLIVFDADLAGATKTATFQKAFPDRHFDCGIAEANMICMAAGMSTAGLVPFASSFAMFAAGRAFEQVRNSIGYPHLNVKIGATHGGISVGEDGASHQCCEDFALMRSIPGMTVISILSPHRNDFFCGDVQFDQIPASARALPASTASATSRPLAMMATSVPWRRTSPLPMVN